MLEIDRCRADRDSPDYKFHSRSMQISALQTLCEVHKLQRFGYTDHLHDLTGEKLHQALSNKWRGLRKPIYAQRGLELLWKDGTECCRQDQLASFRECYDASARGKRLLPSDVITAKKQAFVDIPPRQSNRGDETQTLAFADDSGNEDAKAVSVKTGKYVIPRGKQQLYLYRAIWIALLEIDRCKVDTDDPGYKFRSRQAQTASLHELCQRYDLQRISNTGRRNRFTGEALYLCIFNQWRRLKKRASQSFKVLWREGTASCDQNRLKEYRKLHDAFAKGGRLLPIKKATGGKRSDVFTSATSSENDEYEYEDDDEDEDETMTLPVESSPEDGTRGCSKHADNAILTLGTTPRRSAHDDRKRKRSSHNYTARRSPELQARQFSITLDMPSISPAPVALGDIKEELTAIYSSLRQSVLWRSGHLRLDKCQAVVCPEPNHLLSPLYQRCWGKDWRDGADLLTAAGSRSVEDDTLALISAFLLERIMLRTGLCKLKTKQQDQPGMLASPLFLDEA